MKYLYLYAKILCLIPILLSSFEAQSQRLHKSRQSSPYTYIWKITAEEAEMIYENDIREVEPEFFHSLIDSFPTQQEYKKQLPQGHYLKSFSKRNKEYLFVATVQNFNIYILNNSSDLSIQVYDLQGNAIKNAEILAGTKKIRYNETTQSYVDKKSNKKALLRVTHNGFTAYYRLDRQYDNSLALRIFRKTMFNPPLKYVWKPINFTVRFPADGVRSIIRMYPVGTVYSSKDFLIRAFEKIACLFDDYYCDPPYIFEKKHRGYFVFNKAKYRPGDTVKFKAFITKKNGRPIKNDLNVILQNNYKDIRLGKISPYSKGAYAFSFFLHDSLRLKLDKSYNIKLQESYRKLYSSKYFKYEDYELSKINLSLRADKSVHQKGDTIRLFMKGSDENDLNLPDARVEITVKPLFISKYWKKTVFVPDTFMHIKKKLKASGETQINIPDSLFPKANFTYKVFVRMLNSENESQEQALEIKYQFRSEKLRAKLSGDSLIFAYEVNGKDKSRKAKIFASDKFGNQTEIYSGLLPHTIKPDPYYHKYILKSEKLPAQQITLSSQNSKLRIYSDRENNRVQIFSENPYEIPFSYNIYKKNRQIASGHTDSLSFEQKTRSKKTFSIALQYLWGGEIKEENYALPLSDKELTISTKLAKIVYPGQKTRIEVSVEDYRGRPVENVDLTAYAMTKKFDYSPPSLPYLGRERKGKELINNFHLSNFSQNYPNPRTLNYQQWKQLAGLDSIEYYRYIYPGDSVYSFSYHTPDSLTQFAPFVMSDGQAETVHIIYADSKPVYFSWANNLRPYSFKVDSGYHNVKLRTSDKHIIIDSIYFEAGKKTIISLNKSIQNKKVKTENAETALSSHEQNLLNKYLFPYRKTFNQQIAYLDDGELIHKLSGSPVSYNNAFAGPVSGDLTFQIIDGFSLNFMHEPYFEYEFAPQLLKMRSLEKYRYPTHIFPSHQNNSIYDSLITKKQLEREWQNHIDYQRRIIPQYGNPSKTKAGFGRLKFEIKKQDKEKQKEALNILVFRPNKPEFIRVYPGNINLIQQLEKGMYKLVFFYPESKYQTEDSIIIRPNGLTYYKFKQNPELKRDSFSTKVSEIIEKTIFKPKRYHHDAEEELKEINTHYHTQILYESGEHYIEGVVTDDTGEALPGVSIHIKGTTVGTITDINGRYVLKAPNNPNSRIVFSYIGMETAEKPIGLTRVVNASLSPSDQQLEEVVVTAFGVTRKKASLGYASTTGKTGSAAQVLAGKTAGVQISRAKGTSGEILNIQIRGASSFSFDANPLFIIDGQVYTGDIMKLDHNLIKSATVLKGTEATAIYGSRAANGVVIIDSENNAFKTALSITDKGADYDDDFWQEASKAGAIRNNFSDYAFWKPELQTDKYGKASFEVIYPDDVTGWQSFFLAMNAKKQTGQAQSFIKSYKPLMAKLSVPRFMVQSDTAYAIGKSLNYTPDSVAVKTKLEINGKEQFSKAAYCRDALIDSLTIIAHSDSLNVKYYLETKDDYFDGEQREIPVFPIGMKETVGRFYALDKDTTVDMSFDTSYADVTLYARADVIDVFEAEISRLINYRFLCNEQIASKLKALFALKKIRTFTGREFGYDKEIEKLIRLLTKNRNNAGLWGWWTRSDTESWISLHVLEALAEAEKLGYEVGINKSEFTENFVWKLKNSNNFYEKARILKILNLLNAPIDIKPYLIELEKSEPRNLHKLLVTTELRQAANMEYSIDTLKHFQDTTLFGNVFFSGNTEKTRLHGNSVQNTLTVYRILKKDSSEHEALLLKMRNYLFEERSGGSWSNTYEAAQIIETVLPDLLNKPSYPKKPVLKFKGDFTQNIHKFPFQMTFDPSKNFTLSKTGDYPVYLTTYQRFQNPNPKMKKGDFEIKTHFDNDSSLTLTGGKPVSLITELKVNKDAEYLMINIPIPAGCSYAEKGNNYRNEVHREYFRNETSIFCRFLPKGNYRFEIKLVPRYSGSYSLNPAKVELMYFPVFNANNEAKRVYVK